MILELKFNAEIFKEGDIDTKKLEKYLARAEKLNVSLYIDEIEYAASIKIHALMSEILSVSKSIEILKDVDSVLDVLNKSYMEFDTWKIQNLYFIKWW